MSWTDGGDLDGSDLIIKKHKENNIQEFYDGSKEDIINTTEKTNN